MRFDRAIAERVAFLQLLLHRIARNGAARQLFEPIFAQVVDEFPLGNRPFLAYFLLDHLIGLGLEREAVFDACGLDRLVLADETPIGSNQVIQFEGAFDVAQVAQVIRHGFLLLAGRHHVALDELGTHQLFRMRLLDEPHLEPKGGDVALLGQIVGSRSRRRCSLNGQERECFGF